MGLVRSSYHCECKFCGAKHDWESHWLPVDVLEAVTMAADDVVGAAAMNGECVVGVGPVVKFQVATHAVVVDDTALGEVRS